MGNKGISARGRLGIAAVAIAMFAIVAPVLGTYGSRFGAPTTKSANSSKSIEASRAAAEQRAKGMVASLPLYFEVNRGQTDPSVRYLSHAGRYSLYLTDDATVISMIAGQVRKRPAIATANPPLPKDASRLVQSAVRIRMIGANPHPAMTGIEPLPGYVNYLIGDKANFHTNVPTFARVKIANVYPGVDVIHYGTRDSLEYDIIAAPGADTSKIKFAIEGPAKTSTDRDGNIMIATSAGVVVMRQPVIYQMRADGGRIPVEGSFELSKNGTIVDQVPRREVAIRLAAYDHSRPLVIDPALPILVYSTYIGGSGSSVAPLNEGQFPFLTNNSAITDADVGLDVALDSSNNAYVTGAAFSNDFPHPNAFQSTLQGANSPPNQNPNVFIAKFNYTNPASNAGSLVYATYLGGQGDTVDAGSGNGDLGYGIAVDAANQPFIVGQTYSGTATSGGPNFPGTASCGSFGQSNNGGSASTGLGFISKLKADGSGIVWSCYIDGQNGATESRVALAPAGCGIATQCKAYVAGSTQSSKAAGFPATANSFQADLLNTSGGSNATFIVAHEDGQSLDYATWYGGTGSTTLGDTGSAVAVDSNNRGYITGATFSTNLTLSASPAVSSFQGTSNALESNAFVAEFDPTSSGTASLIYATYLGGSGATGSLKAPNGVPISLSMGDVGTGIAIDTSGYIWVAGVTASTDFEWIPGVSATATAFDQSNEAATGCDTTVNPPATAAFVVEIDTTQTNQSQGSQSNPSQIIYSTYFGGCGFRISVPDLKTGLSTGSIGFGDTATDIAVSSGKVFLTGTAASGGSSSWITTTCDTGFRLDANQSSGFNYESFQPVPLTAYVAELDPTQQSPQNQLVFSTFLGGTGKMDAGSGVKVDSNGNIVVAGLTFSTDFPITSNAFQFANNAAAQKSSNAFLSVINPVGTTCPTPFLTPSPTPTPTGPAKISVSPPYDVLILSAPHGTSTTGKVTITNVGHSTLTGMVGPIPSKVYTETANAGKFSLAPGASEVVTVSYTAPTKPGASKASAFFITGNDKKAKRITMHVRGTSK
jgi:hypothetical protein